MPALCHHGCEVLPQSASKRSACQSPIDHRTTNNTGRSHVPPISCSFVFSPVLIILLGLLGPQLRQGPQHRFHLHGQLGGIARDAVELEHVHLDVPSGRPTRPIPKQHPRLPTTIRSNALPNQLWIVHYKNQLNQLLNHSF